MRLIFDMVYLLPTKPSVARGAVDWLREQCDDVVENCHLVLNSVGLTTLLALTSLWTISTPRYHYLAYLHMHAFTHSNPAVYSTTTTSEVSVKASNTSDEIVIETFKIQQMNNEKLRLGTHYLA